MNQSSILRQTIDYVKETLSGAEGGHDWFHIERVWKNVRLIAQTEDVDMEIVELAALLHDIADSKFHGGDEEIGPRTAQRFLEKEGYPADRTAHVVNIVRHISFKGGKEAVVFTSPELQVVQDADRLDAIGAIGIARAFHYGGFKGRALYDPSIPPNLHMTKEEYKSSPAPTINHFYEKLLLLADRMNTETGRQLAMKRHRFMDGFLDQFYKEWEGR
jgi:uncharacterized protein